MQPLTVFGEQHCYLLILRVKPVVLLLQVPTGTLALPHSSGGMHPAWRSGEAAAAAASLHANNVLSTKGQQH
jgi:hypothetical protein